jgi:hypothetical protein
LAIDGDGWRGLVCGGLVDGELCILFSCRLRVMVLSCWLLVLMALGVGRCLVLDFWCVWLVCHYGLEDVNDGVHGSNYIWRSSRSFGWTES